MNFSLNFVLLSSTLLIASFATPLVKRDGPETIYLTNCVQNSTLPTLNSTITKSEIDFYAVGHDSQHGALPDDTCVVSSGTGNNFTTWEGHTVACTFKTQVTFFSNIVANAQSLANFTLAGTGNNGFHNYNCFKDNQRTLYQNGTNTCSSIYFCLIASG